MPKRRNLWLIRRARAFPSGLQTAGVSDFSQRENCSASISAAARPCRFVMPLWVEAGRGVRTESSYLPPIFEAGSSGFRRQAAYRLQLRKSILPGIVLTAGLISFRTASTFSISHSTTPLPQARTQQFTRRLLMEERIDRSCTRRLVPYMHLVTCCLCTATLSWLNLLMPAASNSRENESPWQPTFKATLEHGGQCSAPLIPVCLSMRKLN